MATREVKVGDVTVGGGNSLVFIAGPCVIENEESTVRTATDLRDIFQRLNAPLVFKSSYDKANRTSLNSFRGPGIGEGLKILGKIRELTGLSVVSDVHTVEEIPRAAEVLDMLQIPAFLCRQTDLILSASASGKPLNIKKGQFLSPWDMSYVIEKAVSTGNRDLVITERGTTFGYNNLVVDMRAIPVMQKFGYPVAFDATHGIQLPGGRGGTSSGEKEFAGPLARAAVSAGCDAVFMEVHSCPEKALCDGPNMFSLDEVPGVVKALKDLGDWLRTRE